MRSILELVKRDVVEGLSLCAAGLRLSREAVVTFYFTFYYRTHCLLNQNLAPELCCAVIVLQIKRR